MLGKAVKSSDGKLIQFNRNDSADHIAHDSRRNHLRALAVPHIADVFQNGEAKGKSDPNHEHKDESIVAFHAYQKWVNLGRNYKVLLEAQAVERSDGLFEFAAYTHKVLEKKSGSTSYTDDSQKTIRVLERLPDGNNLTPAADSAQEEYELLRILRIVDAQGQDVTDSYNEKSPAAQWVDSTVQADGFDPTSIRSAGDIRSLAKTVEQYDMKHKEKHPLAQDRSARTYDKDGRLHVAVSNISKAVVNPYYGGEIPGCNELGLQADKVYYLLRHPDELARAADSFRNLPLLSRHIPVSADDPQKEVVVGSTGSDVVFADGYLKCSLSVWDAEAIGGIKVASRWNCPAPTTTPRT